MLDRKGITFSARKVNKEEIRRTMAVTETKKQIEEAELATNSGEIADTLASRADNTPAQDLQEVDPKRKIVDGLTMTFNEKAHVANGQHFGEQNYYNSFYLPGSFTPHKHGGHHQSPPKAQAQSLSLPSQQRGPEEEHSRDGLRRIEEGEEHKEELPLVVCPSLKCEEIFDAANSPAKKLMLIFLASLGYKNFSKICEENKLSATKDFRELVFNGLTFQKRGRKHLVIDGADFSGSSFVGCQFDKETKLEDVDFSSSNVTNMTIEEHQLYSCWVADVVLCDKHQADPNFILRFQAVVDEQIKWIEKIMQAGKDIHDQWSSPRLECNGDGDSPIRFFSKKNIERIKAIYDENKTEETASIRPSPNRCIVS
jgi:hypothetical protein